MRKEEETNRTIEFRCKRIDVKRPTSSNQQTNFPFEHIFTVHTYIDILLDAFCTLHKRVFSYMFRTQNIIRYSDNNAHWDDRVIWRKIAAQMVSMQHESYDMFNPFINMVSRWNLNAFFIPARKLAAIWDKVYLDNPGVKILLHR